MLPKKLAFVDIETTGSSPSSDRAIEVGIVRVDDGNVRTFQTLLDPGVHVPPFIQDLTGIDARALESAPSFYEVKDEIFGLLEDAVFVAHNVRFDYGFLRHEFRRYNTRLSAKQLCTVRLSRALYPRFRKHDLSTLIERHGFVCESRHRALSDAKVLWDFYQMLLTEFPTDRLVTTISELTKRPSLPPRLSKKYLSILPESPGVYVFYDKGHVPLYVGKSIHIRDRVLSHFTNDHTSARQLELASSVEHIETVETAGDLGAQLLESQMIKDYMPLFNRQLRYCRSLTVLTKKQTESGYLTCEMEEVDGIEAGRATEVLGVFRNRKQVKDFLSGIAQEHQLCQRLLGLHNTQDACFAYHLGWCRGACKNLENPAIYNMRFLQAFAERKIKMWPYTGPIALSETHGSRQDVFVVDQWCVLGKLDPHSLELDSSYSYKFDYDTYKILLRYISQNPHAAKPYSLTNPQSQYFS